MWKRTSRIQDYAALHPAPGTTLDAFSQSKLIKHLWRERCGVDIDSDEQLPAMPREFAERLLNVRYFITRDRQWTTRQRPLWLVVEAPGPGYGVEARSYACNVAGHADNSPPRRGHVAYDVRGRHPRR